MTEKIKELDLMYRGAEEVLCILVGRGSIKKSEMDVLLDSIEERILKLSDLQDEKRIN